MTDLADILPDLTPEPTTRPNGVRREPTAKTLELAKIIDLALVGATYQQITDILLDPTAALEKRDPVRASKVEVDAVRHVLTSPDGQRALRYAINEQQEHTDRFLVSAHLQALRTLVKELNAPKPGDRIRAAQAITSLATKRIEISGPGGGPIDVNAAVIDVLDEKIALMRERSKGIIEAYGIPIGLPTGLTDEDDPPTVAPSGPSAIAERIAEILASVPTPPPVAVEAPPVVSTAPRRRMPAPIIRPPRPR